MNVTFIERSPGAWRLRIELGRDAKGIRQFKYETLHGTADDAARRRHELMTQHEQGTFTEPSKLLVSGYLPAWIKQRQALGKITRSTAENYTTIVNAYILPGLGGYRVQKITGSILQTFYAEFATTPLKTTGRVPAPNTVQHVHRILSKAFKAARKARLVTVNPIEEVEAPSGQRARPKALNEANAQRLMASLAGSWMEPVAALALSTGMRRGELCGLRWQDVDMPAGRLHVRGQLIKYNDGTVEWKTPKTESGLRSIAVSDEVMATLRRARAVAAEARMKAGIGGGLDVAWVFSRDGINPIDPDTLTHKFSDHCEAHGLPAFTFHGTRHTHLTALLRQVGEAGAKAVSKRAGHKKVTTTLEIYQTVFDEDDRALANMSGGLISRGTK